MNETAQQYVYKIQADLCRCMSSAIRIEIVHCLKEGPQRVTEISRLTNRPQAMISRHLGLLRNGGIVTARHHAQEVIYQIANPKIVNICDLMMEMLVEEASHRANLV